MSRLRLVDSHPLSPGGELLSAGLWWTAAGAHSFNPAIPAWLNLLAGLLLVSLLCRSRWSILLISGCLSRSVAPE